MNWLNVKKVYMIGIKGVGMTMLAQYLVGQGIEVSGSDTTEVFMTDEVLSKCGIKVKSGFQADNTDLSSDLIIYSTAYNESNPEVSIALSSKVKVLTYAQALAEIFNQSFGIAVTGSHGKTTISAWLGFVLDKAGLSPSVLVGARVPQFSGSALIGKSNLLVAEADEYQNKLALLRPKMVILNNIDYDHPDFYPDALAYERVFADFIGKLTDKDVVVANFDDPVVRRLSALTKAKIVGFSLSGKEADFSTEQIAYQQGRQYFKVKMGDQDLGDFSTRLLGAHNIGNALAVIAAGLELGVDLYAMRESLAEFSGTARRLEKMGEYGGAIIYDDYAHHPTEIKATIKAVKQAFPDKKLTVVFHPHTFSRTRSFFDGFVNSFADVDRIIVLDIYGSAREQQGGAHSKELAKKMSLVYADKLVIYQPTLTEATDYLRHNLSGDEIVVLMGAGDVFRIGQSLLK